MKMSLEHLVSKNKALPLASFLKETLLLVKLVMTEKHNSLNKQESYFHRLLKNK